MSSAYEEGEVWSEIRCEGCEILLVAIGDSIPACIQRPEWHLDTGGRICVLCEYEREARGRGLPTLEYDNEANRELMVAIVRSARPVGHTASLDT